MAIRNYEQIGWDYAEQVVNKAIPAGQYAIRACQRSLRDRENQCTKAFPYMFVHDLGNQVCAFIERLTHAKGSLRGQFIHLEPWQCWLIHQIFSWVDQNGIRRFTRVYIEVGRGNAKSTLCSGIALYMLAAEGVQSDVYAVATKVDQAKIVFGDAKSMAQHSNSSGMMNKLGVETWKNAITVPRRNSSFVAISSDAKTGDGLNISCCIFDEVHAHKSRELWDVMVSGMGKREEPLLIAITTAGYDRAGVGYEQHLYTRNILDRVFVDESQFGVIWAADPEDDFKQQQTWAKANPNWAVSVMPRQIETEARQATNVPSKLPNFLTKHLCRWVSSSSAWLDPDEFNDCIDKKRSLESFEGERCFIGLDLATVDDIAAKVYLFPTVIEGETHYYVFGTYYLSDRAITDSRNSQYNGWAANGYLTATDGEITDHEVITDELREDLGRFDVQEIAFDQAHAWNVIQPLLKEGAPCIQVSQAPQAISEPSREIERLVRTKRLHHDGNPVLCWAAANCVVRVDTNDNIKPKKDREEDKIDPISALINAVARAMLHVDIRFVYNDTTIRPTGIVILGDPYGPISLKEKEVQLRPDPSLNFMRGIRRW